MVKNLQGFVRICDILEKDLWRFVEIHKDSQDPQKLFMRYWERICRNSQYFGKGFARIHDNVQDFGKGFVGICKTLKRICEVS